MCYFYIPECLNEEPFRFGRCLLELKDQEDSQPLGLKGTVSQDHKWFRIVQRTLAVIWRREEYKKEPQAGIPLVDGRKHT